MTYEEILSQMQQTYHAHTGFDADRASDIGIRLRVLAQQIALLYEKIDELNRQAFPQTSTGAALERHAECRGLYRKSARQAEGILQFSREFPAQQDTPIAAGTLCATGPQPQLQFVTTADSILPAGQTTIDVPARAVVAGNSGNVAPGAVHLMVSTATGMTGVTNPNSFTGGIDDESDAALRSRLLDAYRNISNGTNAAFYYDIAMGQEDVLSAAVLPRARGRGTVDVVVDCARQDTLDTLTKEYEKRREVNVDVAVLQAGIQTSDVTLLLTPTEDSDFAHISTSCAQVLRLHMDSLGVGQAFLRAHLTSKLLALDGVYNVVIQTPASDIFPASNCVVRAGEVQIERLVIR